MKIPITQSQMWQKLQDDLGETSFFRCKKSYQYLAILKSTPAGNYLYLPYGPVATDQAAFDAALADLTTLAREQHAIFVRIEPQNPAYELGKSAHKSHDLSPKETWVLDLTGNEADFKSRLPSRLVRYYNAAGKKGLTIRTSHDPADIHYLLDLQTALAKEKGISTFSASYLQTELRQPFATLYLAEYRDPDSTDSQSLSHTTATKSSRNRQGSSSSAHASASSSHARVTPDPISSSSAPQILAAGLVFDDATTRYNLQGAQSEQGRKLHATGILTLQLIYDARAKGLQTFDFWGIAPEGASESHPWAGFTNFKKTFAGSEVDYLGTHDLVLNPTKYKLYQFLRKLRHLM